MAAAEGTAGGELVGALEVVGQEEVTAVTAMGEVIQVDVASVPEQGRRTRGTRVVGVSGEDRIVEISRSIGQETGNGASNGQGSSNGSEPESPTPSSVESGPGQSDLFGSE